MSQISSEKKEVPSGVRKSRRPNVFSPAIDFDENWKPPIYPKSEEEKKRISTILNENCLFKSYDHNIRTVLIDAVSAKEFKTGDVIISQGEEGDLYYLVEKGKCECWKSIDEKQPILVFTCLPGMGFGELALLHDAPRAATVKAKEDSMCWTLDRETFKRLIMGVTMVQRARYENFLASVPILSTLDQYERQLLADALEPIELEEGITIIQQGKEGDKMYIVEEGEVKCTQTTPDNTEKEVSKRLTTGSYFGELALLFNQPRAASVTTTQPTCVLALERKTFKNLLGPLQNILNRNANLYKNYDEYIPEIENEKSEEEED